MIKIYTLFIVLLGQLAVSADVMQDFDSLGGNKILIDKAKAITPDANIQVVQDRVVQRTRRHEFYPESGYVIGGEAFLNTSSMSGNYQFHINPHWSVGAKYSYFFNSLNNEGQQMLDYATGKAEEAELPMIPDLNWQKQSVMAVTNFYPFYGKMNVFGKAIVHFDIYALAGIGQVELRRNSTNTYMAGVGMGLWFSQHLTSRIEIRYQNYKSEALTTEKNMNLSSASFSLGYML